jgi:hypothetical protein
MAIAASQAMGGSSSYGGWNSERVTYTGRRVKEAWDGILMRLTSMLCDTFSYFVSEATKICGFVKGKKWVSLYLSNVKVKGE